MHQWNVTTNNLSPAKFPAYIQKDSQIHFEYKITLLLFERSSTCLPSVKWVWPRKWMRLVVSHSIVAQIFRYVNVQIRNTK